MCTAVVAGMDAPPVLDLAEHVINLVASPVVDAVVRDRHLAIDL